MATPNAMTEYQPGAWRPIEYDRRKPNHRPVDITHELGPNYEGGTITRHLFIAPSEQPSLVTVSSTVVQEPAGRMNSAEYLATVRRRKAGRIAKEVRGLEKRAGRDDFEAYTFKIVEGIRELLTQLKEIYREGNTREILRQVRDTFMDGGFEQYKQQRARNVVAAIMTTLSEADEVTPDDVDGVWDQLFDNEIKATMPPIVVVGSADAEAQGGD